MKITFYLNLKNSLCSQDILVFVLIFWSCRKTAWLDNVSKFMTSQPGKQIISIHILSNITRSKNIHGIKFGQLIQYNMWNIFIEKSFTEYGRKSVTTPSSNKLNLWSNILQLCTVCFCCMPSWRLSKYIETKLQTTCF